jgi:molybdenum cofactor biosynthesis protein B
MSDFPHAVPRVLVASVIQGKSRHVESVAKCVASEVRHAGLSLVRTVMVNGERQYIQQLVSNVSNGNEADAIILVGGAGIGPRDDTCEAVDTFVERRIEGFGDAYRSLLASDLGVRTLLVRATAGVYNQCLVFAMAGHEAEVRHAMAALIVPVLAEAVDLATGRRPVDPPSGSIGPVSR